MDPLRACSLFTVVDDFWRARRHRGQHEATPRDRNLEALRLRTLDWYACSR
eukprot:NODE_24945_length_604_cov_10.268344.p7 GENE.NODE_24945_length_604_cov_10.268344~~NODE_24945_length_604_cov_10.268344.p7  ORF type:complete len:51 (+),score=15.17 NODE_24945_length_604_cov_10.268344:114-266(+)